MSNAKFHVIVDREERYYISHCEATPPGLKAKAWTTDPAEARTFSHQRALAVATRNQARAVVAVVHDPNEPGVNRPATRDTFLGE